MRGCRSNDPVHGVSAETSAYAPNARNRLGLELQHQACTAALYSLKGVRTCVKIDQQLWRRWLSGSLHASSPLMPSPRTILRQARGIVRSPIVENYSTGGTMVMVPRNNASTGKTPTAITRSVL